MNDDKMLTQLLRVRDSESFHQRLPKNVVYAPVVNSREINDAKTSSQADEKQNGGRNHSENQGVAIGLSRTVNPIYKFKKSSN